MRLAGGPKQSLRERAVAFARKRGEVRTKDLTEIGVHRCYLARMCDEGLLVKVGYGRYRAPDSGADRAGGAA
nr:type IV toxin-antitoxin system AbiEi family antitoxin domain-containing protein [Rhizorhabdus histidinilytica]